MTRRRAHQWNHSHPSPEYTVWQNMIRRCGHSGHSSYHNYGARGIRVCQRWLDSFDDFCDDMGPRPSSRHTLERKNNDGNYEPNNCRWATWTEQANNTRHNRLLTYNGETCSVAEWARRLGIPRQTLLHRLKHSAAEIALSCPRLPHGIRIEVWKARQKCSL
jgi:hypothetical protein